MEYYIIVFKNTYDAMAADKKLGELNYEYRIMPTPTTITMSCGICVRIEDEKYIHEILNDDVISFKNIYQKNKNGYIMIEG